MSLLDGLFEGKGGGTLPVSPTAITGSGVFTLGYIHVVSKMSLGELNLTMESVSPAEALNKRFALKILHSADGQPCNVIAADGNLLEKPPVDGFNGTGEGGTVVSTFSFLTGFRHRYIEWVCVGEGLWCVTSCLDGYPMMLG